MNKIEDLVLINIDNIISIELKKEKISYNMEYYRSKEITIRRGLFRTKSNITLKGGYQYYTHLHCLNTQDYLYETPEELINDTTSPHKYIVRKLNTLLEGPYGTIHDKAHIMIKTIGGKYTHSEYIYFDNNSDAMEFYNDIQKQYHNRLIKLKGY